MKKLTRKVSKVLGRTSTTSIGSGPSVGGEGAHGSRLSLTGSLSAYDVREKDMGKVHKAAWTGDMKKLQQALKKGDINALDKENRTPLHLACARGNVETVQFLCENNAKLNVCDDDMRSPLMKAVQSQFDDCTAILLEHEADTNLVDKDGNTALHLSALIPSLPLLRRCSIMMQGLILRTRTPLMLAGMLGHVGLVKLLLENNADVNIRDNRGWTAEDCASTAGQHARPLPEDFQGEGSHRRKSHSPSMFNPPSPSNVDPLALQSGDQQVMKWMSPEAADLRHERRRLSFETNHSRKGRKKTESQDVPKGGPKRRESDGKGKSQSDVKQKRLRFSSSDSDEDKAKASTDEKSVNQGKMAEASQAVVSKRSRDMVRRKETVNTQSDSVIKKTGKAVRRGSPSAEMCRLIFVSEASSGLSESSPEQNANMGRQQDVDVYSLTTVTDVEIKFSSDTSPCNDDDHQYEEVPYRGRGRDSPQSRRLLGCIRAQCCRTKPAQKPKAAPKLTRYLSRSDESLPEERESGSQQGRGRESRSPRSPRDGGDSWAASDGDRSPSPAADSWGPSEPESIGEKKPGKKVNLAKLLKLDKDDNSQKSGGKGDDSSSDSPTSPHRKDPPGSPTSPSTKDPPGIEWYVNDTKREMSPRTQDSQNSPPLSPTSPRGDATFEPQQHQEEVSHQDTQNSPPLSPTTPKEQRESESQWDSSPAASPSPKHGASSESSDSDDHLRRKISPRHHVSPHGSPVKEPGVNSYPSLGVDSGSDSSHVAVTTLQDELEEAMARGVTPTSPRGPSPIVQGPVRSPPLVPRLPDLEDSVSEWDSSAPPTPVHQNGSVYDMLDKSGSPSRTPRSEGKRNTGHQSPPGTSSPLEPEAPHPSPPPPGQTGLRLSNDDDDWDTTPPATPTPRHGNIQEEGEYEDVIPTGKSKSSPRAKAKAPASADLPEDEDDRKRVLAELGLSDVSEVSSVNFDTENETDQDAPSPLTPRNRPSPSATRSGPKVNQTVSLPELGRAQQNAEKKETPRRRSESQDESDSDWDSDEVLPPSDYSAGKAAGKSPSAPAVMQKRPPLYRGVSQTIEEEDEDQASQLGSARSRHSEVTEEESESEWEREKKLERQKREQEEREEEERRRQQEKERQEQEEQERRERQEREKREQEEKERQAEKTSKSPLSYANDATLKPESCLLLPETQGRGRSQKKGETKKGGRRKKERRRETAQGGGEKRRKELERQEEERRQKEEELRQARERKQREEQKRREEEERKAQERRRREEEEKERLRKEEERRLENEREQQEIKRREEERKRRDETKGKGEKTKRRRKERKRLEEERIRKEKAETRKKEEERRAQQRREEEERLAEEERKEEERQRERKKEEERRQEEKKRQEEARRAEERRIAEERLRSTLRN
ncbi:Ankyrin repeat domain-containing protein 26 [Branchiostoma belcheri]|nr:Ankyrin repeat domain-containing protein 26 [Branchiostoma belcheri]